jgi:hypothetical protein
MTKEKRTLSESEKTPPTSRVKGLPMSNTKEVRTLKLDQPVVVRKMPMTARGCSSLRAVRDYQQRMYLDKHGVEATIPFPTALHLMLEDYIRLLKIKVVDETPEEDKETEKA